MLQYKGHTINLTLFQLNIKFHHSNLVNLEGPILKPGLELGIDTGRRQDVDGRHTVMPLKCAYDGRLDMSASAVPDTKLIV